ncbi:MAG: type II secretion system F family protein [Clostridiales Family XIII bacterium]|jgi:tight adherence protein B|nr:type II secretion system F family protein [Clostridiales Family XIII bacterium]
MTDYRTYELSKKELQRYYLAAGGGLFCLGMLFYENLLLALLVALLAIPGKRFYKEHLAAKQRQTLAVQFKDLLTSLSAAFSVGRHLTEALVEAAENLRLIYPADAPIIREVDGMLTSLTSGREPEREVLMSFADRSASPDIENFVNMYFICRDTGGDTVKAVRSAASQVLGKIEIRRAMLTATAQKKFEAKLLSGLPPVILLFLRVTSPDYLAVLYGNAYGILVMTAALLVMGLAFLWSTKITDIRV